MFDKLKCCKNGVEMAGTWQRRPFVISPWKGNVFVGGWLPNHASSPCTWRMIKKENWNWKPKLHQVMKMRWKLLDQETRRGRKRRGKKQPPTQTHLAQSGQTLKGQEKKNGGRRKRNKTSGGRGRRKRLNQPTTAKPKPTSARAGPNLPIERSTHEIGGQSGTSWWKDDMQKFVFRLKGPPISSHNPLDGLSGQPFELVHN